MKRFLPAIVCLLALVWVAASWRPPQPLDDGFALTQFGKVPVLAGGRVKPLDTVARNSLLIIHGSQSAHLADKKSLTAMRWLTDTLFNAAVADRYPVFIIQNADVLGLFGWEQTDRKYFSYAELQPFCGKSRNRARSPRSCALSSGRPTNAVVNLRNTVALYQKLKSSLQPEGQESGRANWNLRALLQRPESGATARDRKTFDQTRLDETAREIHAINAAEAAPSSRCPHQVMAAPVVKQSALIRDLRASPSGEQLCPDR
jgi:hypothetical protein